MIASPVDVMERFPIRKSRKQKKAFRSEITAYFESLGYSCEVEKGMFGSRNVIVGNPSTARYLVTAHYDTCARMLVPNLITPCSLPLFLLYQLFVTALILVPALALGILVGVLTDYMIGYISICAAALLMMYLIMFGPANPQNVNDNTSGVAAVMDIAADLSPDYRERVCFVLFDLEEAGLLGSAAYQEKHRKETKKQIVINMDCVGEGDWIYLFPTGKLKKDKTCVSAIRSVCGSYDGKTVVMREKGFSVYPSDQVNFPYGLGVCALKRGRFGLYLSRIHTPKDTILETANIKILRDCIIRLICSSAAE